MSVKLRWKGPGGRSHRQEWNYQVAQEMGLLKRSALVLPNWDHAGEDPLEETMAPVQHIMAPYPGFV